MTTWTKEPPSEPGWYWCRLDGYGLLPVRVRDDGTCYPDPFTWRGPDVVNFGPRIPTPAQLEAAREALREAALIAEREQGGERLAAMYRAARAGLEGR